jgi:glycosyltransferase involved in cell wall biosynthesis
MECVLVMPAYNEQECIEQVVRGWLAQFDALFGAQCRLVVVDDGSRDQTGAILDRLAAKEKRLLVTHQPNGGHGAALLHAYRIACELKPDYVFHVDSDDQFKPSDFPKIWALRGQSKFVLGFRRKRNDALHRLVITRILRALNALVFGVWIKDANVPYRLIRGPYLAAELKVLPPDVFAPNIFLAVLAARDGQNLVGMPVHHEERKTGTVSIVRWKLIKICFRCVRELVAFRWNLGTSLRRLREAEGAPPKARRSAS